MTEIIERYRSNTISRISVTHGHDYYDSDRGRDRDVTVTKNYRSRRCLATTHTY